MIGFVVAAAAVWMLFLLPVPHERASIERGPHQVYLGHNGVHIDFVFPRETFFALMPKGWETWSQLSPEKPWLAVGWGDRDFFLHHPTWESVGISDITRAALASPASALRLTFSELPWGYEKAEILLDDPSVQKLIEGIGKSVDVDADGKPRLIHHDENSDEALFVSPLRYHAFYTCNDWTADILETMDLPTPWIVTTSSSVMRYYEDE